MSRVGEHGPARVSLAYSAAQAIAIESRRSSDGKETGGILLGHDRGSSITVSAAGGPGPMAHRSETRFNRDTDFAATLAAQQFQTDGSIWLGEWHTHLGGQRFPSALDIGSYRRHLRDPELLFDRFVSIIVLVRPPAPVMMSAFLVYERWIHEVNVEGAREL